MMKIINILALGLLISCSQINTDSGSYKEPPKLFKLNKTNENLGKHVTSNGKLRTLIIYVAFSDDTTTKSEAWNYSKTKLPSWTQQMINPTTSLDFPNKNLTQYFYEMSHGNLMLYGDIYPKVVVPKHNQKFYKDIAEVNSEILMSIDDEIDFSKYDNWSKGKDRKYVNTPDGKVDLVFIVYRNFENKLYFNKGWTGIAHLHLEDDINTNDGVKISKGRLDKGSGISSRGAKNGFTFMKYVLAHEFGHMLFGAGHIENTTHLALMTGGPVWNASRGMNSWEKEKLGWISYNDIPLAQNTSKILEDYHTTGNAYRIKLSTNEWYILENHQKLSSHDWAKGKGLYIYHVKNANRFTPSVTVNCADGNWDFEFDEVSKKIKRTIPNPSGKNEINFKKTFKRKAYSCYKGVYGDNSAWGDKFDAFNISYNNIISPVSNPSSKNNSKIDFAIEVKKVDGDNLLVDINFNDIYKNTSPAKPQILNISNSNSRIVLNWITNQEPDVISYKVYSSYNKGKKVVLFKNVKNKNVSSIDITSLLQDKNAKLNVAVSAIDKDGFESVKSNYVVVDYSYGKKKWVGIIKEEI